MIYPSSITLKKLRRYQSSHDFSLPSGAWSTSVHGPRQALLQTQVRREVPGLGPFSVKVPEIGWKSVNGLFLAVNL